MDSSVSRRSSSTARFSLSYSARAPSAMSKISSRASFNVAMVSLRISSMARTSSPRLGRNPRRSSFTPSPPEHRSNPAHPLPKPKPALLGNSQRLKGLPVPDHEMPAVYRQESRVLELGEDAGDSLSRSEEHTSELQSRENLV